MTRIQKQNTDFILNKKSNDSYIIGDWLGVEYVHKPVILGFINDVNTNYGSCDTERVIEIKEYGEKTQINLRSFQSRWQAHIWEMSALARETKNMDLHQQLVDISSKITKDWFDRTYDRQNNNLN